MTDGSVSRSPDPSYLDVNITRDPTPLGSDPEMEPITDHTWMIHQLFDLFDTQRMGRIAERELYVGLIESLGMRIMIQFGHGGNDVLADQVMECIQHVCENAEQHMVGVISREEFIAGFQAFEMIRNENSLRVENQSAYGLLEQSNDSVHSDQDKKVTNSVDLNLGIEHLKSKDHGENAFFVHNESALVNQDNDFLASPKKFHQLNNPKKKAEEALKTDITLDPDLRSRGSIFSHRSFFGKKKVGRSVSVFSSVERANESSFIVISSLEERLSLIELNLQRSKVREKLWKEQSQQYCACFYFYLIADLN